LGMGQDVSSGKCQSRGTSRRQGGPAGKGRQSDKDLQKIGKTAARRVSIFGHCINAKPTKRERGRLRKGKRWARRAKKEELAS